MCATLNNYIKIIFYVLSLGYISLMPEQDAIVMGCTSEQSLSKKKIV